jgi:two-component system sensor histidine kinase/response regulator
MARGLPEDAGLVVDLAEDGLQALEFAKQNTYALILMGMKMPHPNGLRPPWRSGRFLLTRKRRFWR